MAGRGVRRTVLRSVGLLLGTVAWVATPIDAQVPSGMTGTVVVVNKPAHTATFVDLASGEVVATTPTGQGPHELLVTGDGTTAVISDYGGGNSLTIMDVASATVLRTVDLSEYSRPHGLDFLPGDSLVAVSSEVTQNVVIVRLRDGAITSVISTAAGGSHMVAATGDGSRLYTGDMASNTVSELDVATGMKTRSFAVPSTPEAVNVSPDGSRVFAGSNDEGLVSVIDVATGAVAPIGRGFEWPYRIYPTPGVEQIIIPDYGAQVVRFLDGASYAELGRIDFAGEGPQGLILHPDGVHLFLSLSLANRIAIIDIRSREVVGYLPSGAGPDGIGYSPLTVGG